MIMNEKLLLITQIHRSGGTFLSQLFDSHSQLYNHPGELEIWKPKPVWGQYKHLVQFYPNNKTWNECFDNLQQERLTQISTTKIFNKPGLNKFSQIQQFKITYSEEKHKQLFHEYFLTLNEITRASVVHIYLKSLFESWDQLQHYPRKYMNCFAANMWCDQISMIRFFQDFPSATVIFLLRRPDTWLKSVLPHRGFSSTDATAALFLLEVWWESLRNLYTYYEIFGSKIIPVIYEDLTDDTENIMKKLCIHLDLNYEPTLVQPTFLGQAIYPNSSFNIDRLGVISNKTRNSPEFTPEIQKWFSNGYMEEYYMARDIIRNKYYK